MLLILNIYSTSPFLSLLLFHLIALGHFTLILAFTSSPLQQFRRIFIFISISLLLSLFGIFTSFFVDIWMRIKLFFYGKKTFIFFLWTIALNQYYLWKWYFDIETIILMHYSDSKMIRNFYVRTNLPWTVISKSQSVHMHNYLNRCGI